MNQIYIYIYPGIGYRNGEQFSGCHGLRSGGEGERETGVAIKEQHERSL